MCLGREELALDSLTTGKALAVTVYLIRKAVGNLRSPAICLRPRAGQPMKLFILYSKL